MNKIMVAGIVRWAVNTAVGALVAKSIITSDDAAAWNNTLTQTLYGLASVGMLVWVLIGNRWPNLVAKVGEFSQVNKVELSPPGKRAAPDSLLANPNVK